MQWRMRRPEGPMASVLREVASDAALTDGAVRTFVWLCGHADGEGVDAAAHEVRRRCGRGKVREQAEELARRGLIVLREGGEELEVEIVQRSSAARAAVVEAAQERHVASRAEAERRRASRPVRGAGRSARAEMDEPRPVTAADLKKAWFAAWRDKWPDMPAPGWGAQELAIAKQLIGRLGGERTLTAVRGAIERWEEIVRRYDLKGYPSIRWCMAYRDTALMEIASGQPIGNDAKLRTEKAGRGKKGEFDEGAASSEESVGWGRRRSS